MKKSKNQKQKNKQIVSLLIGIMMMIISITGVTYAYYQSKITNNKNNKSIISNTKNLKITYADGNGSISASGFTPGFETSKTFTVKNTGDAEATYSIQFDQLINTFQRTQDWTYTLLRGTTQVASGQIASGNHQIILPNTSIAKGVTHSYTLKVHYAYSQENQNIDIKKTLSLKVKIAESVVTWDNATSGTLLYAIKQSNKVVSPTTTPGASISNSTEAVLASATDDYGTSYYFRGAVKNNYVDFAGMCWRIVRILGDGSIKLVLAGQDQCAAIGPNMTSSAFITEQKYSFKHIGSMRAIDLIYSKSDPYRLLDAWYNGTSTILSSGTTVNFTNIASKLSEYDHLIVNTEWCNDTSVDDRYLRDSSLIEVTDPSLAEYVTDTYSTTTRLEANTPNLKCNYIGVGNTTTTKHVGKIGLLTADEVTFAGGKKDIANTTYYLYENATTMPYWTMSPYSVYGYYNGRITPMMWLVYPTAGLAGATSTENAIGAVRPSIVISSNTYAKGDGTTASPYYLT